MASPPTPGALGYRYGLYPFVAENDDEISFQPGERIEILEQDDQYGDGWWQGRNEAGREGLFPALDYTSADPPASTAPSVTSANATSVSDDRRASHASSISRGPNGIVDSAATAAGPSSAAPIVANRPPSPRASTPTKAFASPAANEAALPKSQPSPQMNATLTDVQAAIDQLGARDLGTGASAVSIPLYADEASVRSFASDSLHGGAESLNGADGDEHEQVGWSAKTRRRLAEKAQAENERKLAREAEEAALGRARDESAHKDWQATRSEEPEKTATEGLEFSDESEDDEGHGAATATPRLNGEGRRSPEPTTPATFETATSQQPVLAPPIVLGEQLHHEAPAEKEEDPSPSAAVVPAASAVGLVAAVVAADAVPGARAGSEPVTISSSQVPESTLPTAAERAEQAFHTASTAPSALSQEPSPFQSIVPDQFESPAVTDAKADVEAAAPAAISGSGTPKSRPASIVTRQTSTADLSKGSSSPALPRSTVASSSAATTPHSTKDALPEASREHESSVPAPSSTPMSPIERSSVASTPSGYMSPGNMRRPSSSTGGAGMGSAGVAGEPIEWGVADVVEWAKRRGFDESVWGKFEEHEITGDVLLEMDINLLKEIEITAFGKRMKLAAAIAELRPHSDTRAASIRSGYSPTAATFSPHSSFAGQGGFAGVGPSPGFVFGQQSRTPSMVDPISQPTSAASQYASNWSQEQGPPPANGASSAPPIVGLGFTPDDKSRQASASMSAPVSPMTASNNAVVAPAAAAAPVRAQHTRTASGVESLQGTKIEEEPVNTTESPSVNLSSPILGPSASSPIPRSPATFSRADAVSLDSRTLDSRTVDSGSMPPSPGSSATFPAKKGTISHKKSKASVDEKSSFMGGFMSGSKNGRKPAPRAASGTSVASPDLASKSPRMGSTSSNFRRPPKGGDQAGTMKKRMSVVEPENSPRFPQGESNPDAARALDRIPKPEFAGFLRKKGERYNSWKLRYCVLAGPHFYYLKSENDAKFKGYINLTGYKIIADENANPGSYGFRIIHDKEPTHFFSLQDQSQIREWMKALMKATITRDYSAPVVSSAVVPTMSLKEAQAMSPAPRPPSPSERLATQLASRRDNPNQLTARDASILMGVQNGGGTKPNVPDARGMPASVPPRPSRDISRSSLSAAAGGPTEQARRASNTQAASAGSTRPLSGSNSRPLSNGRPVSGGPAASTSQMQFINANLPTDFPPVTSNPESFRSGLALIRAVEHITGVSSGIPIKDFVVKTKQEHEDIIIRVFDYLIDSGVNVDGLHVDDVVQGNASGIDRIVDRIREMKASR